ncbi:MAG TPA: N-acetyl-1-D-myo-inositol-2-amino-2-deoxy-alpha-D-glucopyranoside deacetylase [Mycobacteriales bacterium]|jgi:N-acetyl-1-D-myo-inositol-2-amino-2-deoxy-alpha-D-glucopyranoside deacetylase|nr:N-acetyl-1-D-myo-inositol-2-amino-2-deoxy-alpha-D-glucopyranoside deacetylase [Mycobacteriales bacterium]
MTTPAARRLLLVHAHPDDETIGTGATMARYSAEGAAVSLVTCTLGEEGEVVVPALEHLAASRDDTLGQFRIAELSAACAALGVRDHRYLGAPGRWRDSGMMGTPENERESCFWRADPVETTAALTTVLRELRPHVVVTYDDNGGYGHPDHIQAHRVTVAAVDAAADPAYRPDLGPAWQTPKLYWTALPKSVLAEGIELMRRTDHDFFGVDSVDDLPFGTPDALVTTAVDGREFLAAKTAAMKAHATQIRTDGPFFALADGVGHNAFGVEYFTLARGDAVRDGDGHESDLFAGLG